MVKGIMIGAALGVVGLAAAIIIWKHYIGKKRLLISEEKEYVDELTIGVIKSWVKKHRKNDNSKTVFIRPTKENLRKYNLSELEKYEDENAVVMAVYDGENDNVSSLSVIVFSSISRGVEELLLDNGGVIIFD